MNKRNVARFAGLLVLLVAPAAGCANGRAASAHAVSSRRSTPGARAVRQSTGGHTAQATPSTRASGGPTSGSAATAPAPPGSPGADTGALAPATPGTYTYRQSGSASAGGASEPAPPQGTTVVDAPTPRGPGTWIQVWHTYLGPGQPPSDSTFEFAPGGISIVAEVLRSTYDGQSVSFTCSFNPPIELVDWPVRVGYRFSGTGNCGSSTANVTGGVTGTQETTLDGTPVLAYVLQTAVNVQGQIDATADETDWLDPALRLDVHQASTTHGTYGPFSFAGHVTRDLGSGRPS